MHELIVFTERFKTTKKQTAARLTADFRDGAYHVALGDHHWVVRSDWVTERPETDDVAFIGGMILSMCQNIAFETDLRVSEGCLRSVENLRYALRTLRHRKIYFPDYRLGPIVKNPAPRTENGVLCVSGGLDSTFSAFLNQKEKLGLTHGMVMIGADYDDNADPRNAVLRDRTRILCERFGLEHKAVEISPSFVKLVLWRMFHPVVLWMLTKYLEPRVSRSAISADLTLVGELGLFPWGNCSAIVRCISDVTFPVAHVGIDYPRYRKMAVLVEEARDIVPNMIVCGKLTSAGMNCGQCKKCIRTQLNLVAAGHPMPEIFAEHPDLEQWLRKPQRFRGQKQLRATLVRAVEYEVSLPKGPLRDAAALFRKRVEDAVIPMGRI